MRRVALSCLSSLALVTVALMWSIIGADDASAPTSDAGGYTRVTKRGAGPTALVEVIQPRFLSYAPGLSGRSPRREPQPMPPRVPSDSRPAHASQRGVARPAASAPIAFPTVRIRARPDRWADHYRRMRHRRLRNRRLRRAYYARYNRHRQMRFSRQRPQRIRAGASVMMGSALARTPAGADLGAGGRVTAQSSLAGLPPQLAALLRRAAGPSVQPNAPQNTHALAAHDELDATATAPAERDAQRELSGAIDGLIAVLDPVTRERTHAHRAFGAGATTRLLAELRELRSALVTPTCVTGPCLRQLAGQLRDASAALAETEPVAPERATDDAASDLVV